MPSNNNSRSRRRAQYDDDFAESVNITDAQLIDRTTNDQVEGEPDEPLESWQPHRMHDIDFNEEEDEYTEEPDWCFLCQVSQSKYDASSNHNLQGLLRYFDENYHLVAPKTLASEAQVS